MGACASKFKVLKSADGADLPEEDVKSSRELLVKKDAETPTAADDEHSKRQMLGNLLREDAGEPMAREYDGNESSKVKQEDEQKVQPQENENVKSTESLVTDAPVKDARLVLESRALEEVKKSHDGETANKNVETVVSQKVTEENSVEAAKIEASGEVDNQGTKKPGEIEKSIEVSSLSKEMEVQCLDKAVEEKIVVEKETQEKNDADKTKEVGVPEVDKPVLETEMEKKPEVVMEACVPEVEIKEELKPVLETATEKELEVVMVVSEPAETVKNDEKKPASIMEDVEKEQQHAEKEVEVPVNGTNDKVKLPSSTAAAEKEIENKQGETTPTLETPGTEKLDSEVEMDMKKESDEAARIELSAKKHDEQELKETDVVGVEKPATTSNAEEEKSEDQPAAVGNTKIEASAELKAEDIQLVADETTKIECDENTQVDKVKEAEPANKEQPIGTNNKSEEDR